MMWEVLVRFFVCILALCLMWGGGIGPGRVVMSEARATYRSSTAIIVGLIPVNRLVEP